MTIDYRTLIRKRRRELEITQQELADRVGMSRQCLNQIENQKLGMRLQTFLTILYELHLKMEVVEDGRPD